MSKITIWHNARCSKSRASFQLLEEKGVEFDTRKYLDDVPSKQEIEELLAKLGMAPREMMRTGESIYKELGLKDVNSTEQLIEAMVANPKLIERPIVIRGDRAVIGRPIQNVEEFIAD